MNEFAFVFTILFMLVGPLKLIGSFARATRGAEPSFKRSVAIRAELIAAAVCVFVVVAGGSLLSKYHISLDALRIATGLVLLISALVTIFGRVRSPGPGSGAPSAIQLAASPVALPGILPPAGIAAILIGTQFPGMIQAVVLCLAILMVLDFLVMYFIDSIVKTPGLTVVLGVLGDVLVFVQVCLAVEVFLTAFKNLGIVGV
jgi:multiple antibiotic resistance protein